MIDSFDERQADANAPGVTVPETQCKIFSRDTHDVVFIHPDYSDAYTQLLEGIRQKGGLSVITGPAGIGKTLLLKQVANASPENFRFIFCQARDCDYNALLALISDAVGIAEQREDISGKLAGLKTCFDDFAAQGIHLVLVIDDAHSLNADVLSYLAGLLDLSKQWLLDDDVLRLVLSGVPELEMTLHKVQIKAQNIPPDTVYVRLEPLSATAIESFISRMLESVDGVDVDSRLLGSPEAVEIISRYTGGIPRAIKALCEQLLSALQASEGKPWSSTFLDEVAREWALKEATTGQKRVDLPEVGSVPVTAEALAVTAHSDQPAKNVFESLLKPAPAGAALDKAESLLEDRAAYPTTAVSFDAPRTRVASLFPSQNAREDTARRALDALLNPADTGAAFAKPVTPVNESLLEDRAAYPTTAVSFDAPRTRVASLFHPPQSTKTAAAEPSLEALLKPAEAGTGFDPSVKTMEVDASLLEDRTAYPVTAVSFETGRSTQQMPRAQSTDQKPVSTNQTTEITESTESNPRTAVLSEEAGKELLDSLLMDETGSGAVAALPWKNGLQEKNSPRFFQSPSFRGGLVLGLGLLAGLGGGIGGLYLFQQPSDPVATASLPPAVNPSRAASTPTPTPPASVSASPPTLTQDVHDVKESSPPTEPLAVPPPPFVTTAQGGSVVPAAQADPVTPPVAVTPLAPPPEVMNPPAVVPAIPAAGSSASVQNVTETPLIATYMKKGHALLALGDVASARLFYEQAANSGFAEAMTAVGGTYDPVVLGGQGIKGFRADPVKAAEWYLKAKAAGDAATAARLDGLKRWLSSAPALQEAEVNALRQRLD